MEKRDFYARGDISRDYDRLRFGGPGGAWVNQRELDVVEAFADRVLKLSEGRIIHDRLL